MEDKSRKLFREESLEKAESPENINSYIRVISPGVWALVIAIIVAILGIIIWAVFGTVNSKADVKFRAEESGKAIVYLNESLIDNVKKGNSVLINGVTGKVTRIDMEPYMACDVLDDYLIHVNEIYGDTWVYEIHTNITVEPGIHSAEIVKETISPISFMLGDYSK